MSRLKNYITKLHKSTKRNYVERMINDKIKCSKIAKKYEKQYWDGNRKFGYGGYKYIPGRWTSVAKKIINDYKLKPGSHVLDIGCGKGFLLSEMLMIIPELKVVGLDISNHAIKNSPTNMKNKLFNHDIRKKLNFSDKKFDLVISLVTLHNFKIFELEKIFSEINRVSKKAYLMVESYRNVEELFNLQCWALTCESFFFQEEWLWIFKKFSYEGDYEFIYFE